MGPLVLLLLSTPYAELLHDHVHEGLVDYPGLAQEQAKLDRVLKEIAEAKLPEGREARIGFWIDAYNAIVLAEVLRNHQPKSVLDVPDFFKAQRHLVAGEKLSLDQLEKARIQPYAKDPRLHFALVCGAKGCPILEGQPWTEGPLEQRLTQATRRFLASPAGLRLGPGAVSLSKLFEWYSADFGGEDGIYQLLRRDGPKGVPAQRAKISYFEYDWRLNAR